MVDKVNNTYYITTPLYYPSGDWHIGHCYTTVNCDAIARYYRSKGRDVIFGTGMDEHGQKVANVAHSKGLSAQAHVDERADNIKMLWSMLDVQYDIFIRTTEDYHKQAVQNIFVDLYNKGDIYKSAYKGKYCTPCESFWQPKQLINDNCPDCNRPVVDAQEECYFFRLSKYADRLLDLLQNSNFLQPQARVNEMVNFVRSGLEDLAVTRVSVEWGIRVPFDKKHTIYVWIDALSNYITQLGYNGSDAINMDRFWPCDLHMVGKEIVRFHAIIWPALLMALDVPVPRQVYGHGWLLLGGDKMSKSKGNTADPFVLVKRYGVDAFRYYLLREVPFGSDGTYSLELFIKRINADLVNIYGNLVSRTFAMTIQNFGGCLTHSGVFDQFDSIFINQLDDTVHRVDSFMKSLNISKAIETIIELASLANKYVDDTQPWILAKQSDSRNRLQQVLYNLLESVRVCSTLLVPFLPDKPSRVLEALGHSDNKYQLSDIEILYPRLDISKELCR